MSFYGIISSLGTNRPRLHHSPQEGWSHHMLQISIEAMPLTLAPEERGRIKEILKAECPRRFFPNRQLTAGSFSLAFPVLCADSELTHDVVVRIYLHADEERVNDAGTNAFGLEVLLSMALNKEGVPERRVGVSISLSTIAWANHNGPV